MPLNDNNRKKTTYPFRRRRPRPVETTTETEEIITVVTQSVEVVTGGGLIFVDFVPTTREHYVIFNVDSEVKI